MLFNGTKDWKQYLSLEDEERMNELLRKISKYRGAYKNASDIKIAQLWCALLETRKENKVLLKKIQRTERFFSAMFEIQRKNEEEERELLASLEKF